MKLRIFIVVLILAAQIAGLAYVSYLREREWRNNPTFRLQCTSYDPRDLLRGHYLPLDFKILDDIPFSKFDAEAQEKIRKELADDIERVLSGEVSSSRSYSFSRLPDFWLVLVPALETGFWEVERVTASDPKIDFNANPEAGKVVLRSGKKLGYWSLAVCIRRPKRNESIPENLQPANESELLFSFEDSRTFFPNGRFYLSEEKAKEFDRRYGRASENVSAELFLRSDGTPVIKRIFVNGEEF